MMKHRETPMKNYETRKKQQGKIMKKIGTKLKMMRNRETTQKNEKIEKQQ